MVEVRYRNQNDSGEKKSPLSSSRLTIKVNNGTFLNQGRKNAITEQNTLGKAREHSQDITAK